MCRQAGPHKTVHGSCVQMYLLIHDHIPPRLPLFSALLGVLSLLHSDTEE